MAPYGCFSAEPPDTFRTLEPSLGKHSKKGLEHHSTQKKHKNVVEQQV